MNPERWLRPDGMFDPSGHAAAVAPLPSDIGLLSGIVQGLLVHSAWLPHYEIDPNQLGSISRETLPVADRLAQILGRDPCCLGVARPPDGRAIGTCRDFALMLCSFLRCKNVAARVRCGFAGYFHAGWEDHWVCEYWDQPTLAWRLADAQLDLVIKEQCRIAFDPTNVPRDAFLTAGQAWQACRTGRCDPNRFGQGDVTGLWFVKINAIRDHFAVNDRVTSAWDTWRHAPIPKRVVDEREAALLNRISAHPEQKSIEMVPDW